MVVWSLDSEYPWALCRIRRPRTRTSSHCSADKILLNKNMIYPSICSQQKIHEDSLKEEFLLVYYAHIRSSSRAVLPLCIVNVSMIVNQTISMTMISPVRLQAPYNLQNIVCLFTSMFDKLVHFSLMQGVVQVFR